MREVLIQLGVSSSLCPFSWTNSTGWNKPRQTNGLGQFLFLEPQSLAKDEVLMERFQVAGMTAVTGVNRRKGENNCMTKLNKPKEQ
jgi:hypothetical protein